MQASKFSAAVARSLSVQIVEAAPTFPAEELFSHPNLARAGRAFTLDQQGSQERLALQTPEQRPEGPRPAQVPLPRPR